MALFILSEDEGKKLNKKQIPIPKNVQKKLKSNLSLYNGYSQTKGYKRLNSLVDDDYNKRSQKSNKTKDGGKTLSFSDAKRIDHDMRHMVQNPKNLEYQMLGGDDTRNWLHDALGSVRNANKQVQKVPQVPKLQKNPEKVKDVDKDFKYGNANVRITESSNDWLPYFDYCDDYENIRNVMDEFADNPTGKENWAPLINPGMYKKALSEFTKYGKFIHFPTKYVYSWIGIIMRNTGKLRANTILAGHDTHDPSEEITECIEEIPRLRSILGIKDDDDLSELDYGIISDMLDKAGFYDWMACPDGSDAWSDFGIEPIERLLTEYRENSSPEETIVIINKILDVYHQRGDLSSIFIEGGSKSLTSISEEQKLPKNIIITESQLQLLKEYHGDQLLPFDGNGNKMNIEHYIDFLEHIGRFGRLESRLGKDKAQFQIFLSQVQEDGFGYWYHNFDTSSFEDDGMELNGDDIRQLYYGKLSEYHFPEGLDIDEKGLIYCERTIKIPSPMKTAYDKAYYNYIVQYSSVGEYWTWLEGNGEAYCGSGGMDITLIGRTRPEDVDWDETFMRNAYELNEECELYLGYSSLVQINAIRLNDRVINLPRSIVVPAYSSVSPKEIYKSILPNRSIEKA